MRRRLGGPCFFILALVLSSFQSLCSASLNSRANSDDTNYSFGTHASKPQKKSFIYGSNYGTMGLGNNYIKH